MLDPSASDSFAVLQQALVEFAEHGDSDASLDGMVAAARNAVHDFIAVSCTDMAKAVPWDAEGVLKQARSDVIQLAKVALGALAAMDDPGTTLDDELRKIADARRSYSVLVQQLNAKDRELLAEERRRVS
jgi:hypothetical protein